MTLISCILKASQRICKMLPKQTFCFLMFLICIALGGTHGRFYRFDYKYSQEAEGWLKFHRVPSTWKQARLICHAEGAVLASPINDHIAQEMKKMIRDAGVTCGIFTGIHAQFAKGMYSSIEGIPLSKIQISWAPDEPDDYQHSEDCLTMLSNGNMADVNCNGIFPYMCYRKKTKSDVMGRCGTFDTKYTLDSRTGSCYKFHTIAATWSHAYMTCAAEGGHLAIINSHVEAMALKELFAKYPDDQIRYSKHRGNALLGFIDWDKGGNWFTIHGSTLQEAGYSNWGKDQPDQNTQYCGSMFRSSLLDNMWCEYNAPFICEKDPDSLVNDTKVTT